jgi:hypothetical protein
MAFYAMPFGHLEWRVDRRDPRPVAKRGDSRPKQVRRK